MSGQHCENYDVKRETVHCYPRNVDRCCTWSLESQRSFQILLLFCYIINHLITGPLENSEFRFPRISMFPSTSSRETLRFSGNKIHCSPRDQSLSVKCYTLGPGMAQWWELSPPTNVAWVQFRSCAIYWLSSMLARASLEVVWLFKVQQYRTPMFLHLEKPLFQNSNLIRREVRTWKPAKADVAFCLNI